MTVGTTVDAAVLAGVATRFEEADNRMRTVLSALLGELAGLRAAWQGMGGDGFDAVRQAWTRDQQALHRALGETAVALRAAAGRYDATDSAAADRVAAAGAGLWR